MSSLVVPSAPSLRTPRPWSAGSGRPTVIIGAVLVPGARTPQLVNRDMLRAVRAHSVVVDVAIDQGGCFETSRATTHEDPTIEIDGVLHYCVVNMPGAVPVTATNALTNATLPYVRRLADLGVENALAADTGLHRGLNVRAFQIAHDPVRHAYEANAPPGRPSDIEPASVQPLG